MLKFNEETKVVFASDEPAVAPVREITPDDIPDLIANGATVEHSAHATVAAASESVPNAISGTPATADSATLSEEPAQSTETPNSVKPSESSLTETPALVSASDSAEHSESIPMSSVESEAPKDLSASTSGIEHESTQNAPISAADDPNGVASNVAEKSESDTPSSALDAPIVAGVSPNDGDILAETPATLEQRVADLERALVSLPHSIATVMHRGSMDAGDFAKAVLAHLFDKE